MALTDLPELLYADEATLVASFRSVVFTVWGFRPLSVDGARAQCRLCEAKGKRLGRGRLVEVVLLDPEVPVPDGPVRAVLDENVARVGPYYACVATLFQGQGFRAAFIRGVLTSLQLVSRTPFPQKVFDDVDRCVAFAAQHLGAGGPAGAAEPRELAEALALVRVNAVERGVLSG